MFLDASENIIFPDKLYDLDYKNFQILANLINHDTTLDEHNM